MTEIEAISDLLKERNQKCKLYKNIKDEKPEKDNSGIKYVSFTVAILSVVAMVVVIIVNVIIPSNIYKSAMTLYDNHEYDKAKILFEELNGYSNSNDMVIACEDGKKQDEYDRAQSLYTEKQFEEAKVIFESLEDFKDSKAMLEACDNGIKDIEYEKARKLYAEKKYDDAKAIFEKLDSYKDSKEMLISIATSINEDKYLEAEKFFNAQNYVEAMKLYKELNDYKDSKQKIETVKNRLDKDGSIYYGSYNNEPIAWQVVELQDDKMLLIAKNAICELPYNDELKDVSWQQSSINTWMTKEFIKSFSEEQEKNILDTKIDGNNVKIFLLDKAKYDELDNDEIKSSDKDWWINTKAETKTNYMFVSKSGEINEDGDSVLRAKGVRPCMWISIK